MNAQALQVSGIDRTTKNPDGGEILKDQTGDPTGLLRETAEELIKEPKPTAAEEEARTRRLLELADQEALSKGITTFVDAGSPLETIDVMKKMVDEKKIGVRLWVMIRQPNAVIGPKLAAVPDGRLRDGHLTVRAIKKQIDGALGSRGAWMLEPYADNPTAPA